MKEVTIFNSCNLENDRDLLKNCTHILKYFLVVEETPEVYLSSQNVSMVVSGIKAVTPSAMNSPTGSNSFTPTATPCNSPDATPDHSRSTSPERPEAFSLPQLILSSVPQFLRDSMGGGAKRKTSFRSSRRGKKADVSYQAVSL